MGTEKYFHSSNLKDILIVISHKLFNYFGIFLQLNNDYVTMPKYCIRINFRMAKFFENMVNSRFQKNIFEYLN